MREINDLRKSPPEGIRVQTNEEDMLDVTGIIEGPEGTPYAGGYFRVRFQFTEEFPAAPPKCWFSTKLFHPNVGPGGEICVSTLKKDWKSTYGIAHILVTVKCLLIYPNPESALDEEAGKMLMEDYDSYCSRARLITSVHATPKTRPVEFDTPSSSDADSKQNNATAPGSTTPSEDATSNTSVASAVASTSKATSPDPIVTPSTITAAHLRLPSLSSFSTTSKLGFPSPISRKSPSPAPQYPSMMSMKSVTENQREGSGFALKNERHTSPAPLSTADANVAGKAKMGMAGSGLGLGLAPGGASGAADANAAGSKAMKRSATSTAVSGAEKRKKALKRL